MPLHHAGTQILKTKRLVLRPFSLDDAQAMYDNWASDPQVTRFMNWSTHESIEVTRTILAEWVPQYQNPSYYHWCITLEGEPVGATAILNIQERSMAGELGYNIGRKWWRQGITSEAAQAVLADLEALTSTAQILEIFSETFSAICLAAAEEEAVVRTMAR